MSATPAYQFDIPDSQYAAGLNDGEKALTVNASIDAVPPRTSWYMSRYMLFDGGTYTLKINGSDPFTFAIGPSGSSTRRVINGSPQTGFPYSADFYVRPGRQRLDLSLFNVSLPPDPYAVGWTPSPSSCYVAFSIWKNGQPIYVSTAANWVFDSTMLPDSALSPTEDPRLALPIWTISPNWKGGVLEVLSFKTEILVSESDSEQRRSLMRHPRRSIEASFLRAGINQQRMNEFFTGVGSRKCLVPFWPEQMRTPQPLQIGDNSFVFDAHALDGREFFSGGMFILTKDGDPTVFEAFTYGLADVPEDGTVVMFFAQPGGGASRVWPEGSRITPLYEAYLDGIPAMSYVTDRVATAQIRFNFDNTVSHIVPSWNYCAPLWRFPIDWSQASSETFNRLANVIDSEIGPIDVFDYSGVTRIGQSLGITLFGRDAVVNYRGFITMARGKTVRFWMPSNHNDILPTGNSISGTSFQGKSNGYSDWLIDPQDAKLMVAIQFKSGSPTIYRRLLSVTKGSGTDIYSVDEAIPTIPVDTISRMSFVMPVRFNQDSFELNHVVDSLAVVKVAPAIMSAEILNMPSIDCWVTSRPYPAMEIDGIKSSAVVIDGYFQITVESLTSSGLVIDGSFPSSSIEYDAPWEDGLTTSGLVVSGTIVEYIYSSYDDGEDALRSSALLVGGSFPQDLITYIIPLEGITSAGLLTSGTLT